MKLEIVEKTVIFPEEERSSSMCHASCICRLSDGTLLCVWFGGSREGAGDVSIYGSRRGAGGWEQPEMIAKDTPAAHWNPVLFERPDHTLLLFYKVGDVIANWKTYVRESTDTGHTFSAPRELVPGDAGGRGPVRCKPVLLSDGSILAGASTEKGIWTAYADRSEDAGMTWQLTAPIRLSEKQYGSDELPEKPIAADEKNDEEEAEESSHAIPLTEQSFHGRGIIQPTLWESSPGKVHMLLRSSEGKIFRADSDDSGRSFGMPYDTGLPNNNSGIDAAHLPDGTILLCMNPVSKNFGQRSPLVLLSSADNGHTWQQELVLEDGPDPEKGGSGEYSYPSLITYGRDIYITHTFNRRTIAFIHLRANEV